MADKPYPLGHPLNPIQGDLWDQPGHKLVPTNLDGVHGRGVALQAKTLKLIDFRHWDVASSPRGKKVYCIAVKGQDPSTATHPGHAWSEKVTGKNLPLLKSQLNYLYMWDVKNMLYSPMLGMGFGEGKAEEIMPILTWAWELFAGRLYFVEPTKEVLTKWASTLTPGARKDKRV